MHLVLPCVISYNAPLCSLLHFPLHPSGILHALLQVKGTIHWVSKTNNVALEARLYENLFNKPVPSGLEDVNPDSLKVASVVG